MGKRLLLTIFIIGVLAVVGTWVLVHDAADRMLESQARSESLGWAHFVRKDLIDLDRILRGAPPTINDIQTLGTAKNVGHVFWFKIYDHDSTVIWSADFNQVGDENTAPFFKNIVTKGREFVYLTHTDSEHKSMIGHAFLPIMEGTSFKGAIEVSLDLSKDAQSIHEMTFFVTSTIATLFLVLLLSTAFFVRKEIAHQRYLRLAAEQAAKARNDFVAMVSHELRTPLNGILGALGLLSETKQNKNQIQLTRTTIHSAEHLLGVINDILDFTQVSGHRATLSPSIINMTELALETEVMFNVEANEKGITFEVIKEFSENTQGEIDLQRLRQIIFNLTSNAIKFTAQGCIKLHFKVQDNEHERRLLCNVSDTGIGMSEEDQRHVFKRFHQVGDTMSRQHGGIGLGLSVCQELAHLMGGTLTLTSRLGKGSLFSLDIPFPESTSLTKPQEGTLSQALEAKPLRILLAEDNAINQLVIKSILQADGHSITIANNGQEAVIEATRNEYDLILMDIQMPELNGLEATQKIRDHEGVNQYTPIIALSANILTGEQGAYLDAGMQACLSKPIKPTELRQKVLTLHHQHGK